ncbi:putative receptor-like protein kinase [Acorus gramineus]|uniref:Receptor-like protein kinase n=1 Tax=Acorus gramineus TaxID=55184 RepID=A0AAV9ADN4_ACOGR|nr:putative receptor-like protein kinase [Acorus gramineus]
MAKRKLQTHLRNLTVLLPLLLISAASDYNPADNYLLNCGSSSSATPTNDGDNRAFLPDTNPKSFTASFSNDASAQDPNPPSGASDLYRTARVFTGDSSYNFGAPSSGTHLVRLHFYAFSSKDHNLTSALFNVSAGGHLLLSGFTAPSRTRVVKEFPIDVQGKTVEISFLPSQNSFAFVNAIEFFTAPDGLFSGSPVRSFSRSAKLENGVSNQAFETVYRINVGGQKVTPSNDTVWRTWTADDASYLFVASAGVAFNTTAAINYGNGGSSQEIAPDSVYNSARAMENKTEHVGENPNFNVTWVMDVAPGSAYLVRLHFCDIVSSTPSLLYFDAYINDNTVLTDFNPGSVTNQQLNAPLYKDYLADPYMKDSTQYAIRVSVGKSSQSDPRQINALLNGLEIFRLTSGSAPSVSTSKKSTSVVAVVAGVVGGVALLGLLIAAVVFVRRRRKSPKKTEPSNNWRPVLVNGKISNSYSTSSGLVEGTVGSVSPNVNLGLQISLADLKFATKGFKESLVIGSGGFGKVYKGVLRDETRIAVKRASRGSRQGFPEFQTEILLLSRIRHKHLVSLIGYCEEPPEMILVYEFMEKGTLKEHLYGSDAPCLSWKQRLEVCIGAARGLHYLHTGSSQAIIHRDVKSSNILLAEDYTAKVSDFGLSKEGPSYGQTHVSTAVKGSFGYLDPEYFKTQQLTTKSDVYSFGVVLLEVLCARPVINPVLAREQVNLAEWALHWQRKGSLEKVIDPQLVGKINPNSLRKFGETAEKCLAEHGDDRPSVGDVLWNLEYALQIQETGMQRRDPHEDSTNNAIDLPFAPVIRRMPSNSMTMTDVSRMEGRSEVTDSQVFSQLITNEGR